MNRVVTVDLSDVVVASISHYVIFFLWLYLRMIKHAGRVHCE
jgi:hypothetical protein